MSKKLFDIVENAIWNDLIDQRRPCGYRLPSEAELCKQYDCSRQTVRKALAGLAQKGVLTSRQGSGSFVARPLSVRDPQDIALIVPTLNSFIYPDIAGGVESTLSRNGYRLSLYQASAVFNERDVLQRLLDDPPAGLIITNSQPVTPWADYYSRLREMGVPLVVMGSVCYNIQDCSSVVMDCFSAGQRAADLLAEAGCRDICGLFVYNNSAHYERSCGFLNGLARNGIPLTANSAFFFSHVTPRLVPSYLIEEDHLAPGDDARIREIVAHADGIFVGDLSVGFVVKILLECGRVPGKDISVLSITNSHYLDYISTPLSALSHAKERLGMAAAQQMMRLLKGGANENISLPFEYVDRGSICTLG